MNRIPARWSLAAVLLIYPAPARADIDGPRGIHVLGNLTGNQLANIRTGYSFVDGFTLRAKWSDIETAPGVYNFSVIDQAIAQLQPANQKLTLEVFPNFVPSHVMSQVTQTFVDSRGSTVPVPWDAAAKNSWTTFQQAMAAHSVFDSTVNHNVALANHPTLSTVDASIVGQQSYRELTGNLVSQPTYNRTTYINAIKDSVHASRDAFPNKFGFLATFSMNDSNLAQPLDFAVRDALMADFNGPGEETLGFFVENLADATPQSGIALTRILDTTKNDTYTPMQALTSWVSPFTNPSAVASGNPATGIAYAYNTWGTTYFELYVADIDAAVNGALDAQGHPLLADLQSWHNTLVPEPGMFGLLAVAGGLLIVRRRRLGACVIAGLLAPAFCTTASATTTTVTVFSPSNNRNISFVVYTPPNYNSSSQRYPTVISLHGIGGTATGRANQVVPTLDAAITAGTAMPMIYVFPDGQTDSFYGDAFDGHKQVYSNVINEVLPYVDSHYRTIIDRRYRAMEGFSMGGYGATMYTAKHTELFSAVVEYGGALSKWADLVSFNPAVASGMYNSVEANFLPYSLWDLTAQNANALRTTVNYKMIVGDADPQQSSNQRLRDYLLSLNIDPHYQVLPGVAHLGDVYYQEGSGLQFLNTHFANAPEPAGVALLIAPLICLKRSRRSAAA